jgi:hypothetical protein
MTTLTTGNLSATALGGTISVANGHHFAQVGSPIQVLYFRNDARSTYSAPIGGNGTPVSDLNVTITPKIASSLLIMRWMIHGEIHYDTSWTLHMDGQIITTSGSEGYNSQVGNVRWGGIAAAPYDQNDQSTTPFHTFLQIAMPALTTNTRTYTPAIRSSGGTAYTLYLNRPVSSTGTDGQEVGVSTGVIMEIAQ